MASSVSSRLGSMDDAPCNKVFRAKKVNILLHSMKILISKILTSKSSDFILDKALMPSLASLTQICIHEGCCRMMEVGSFQIRLPY